MGQRAMLVKFLSIIPFGKLAGAEAPFLPKWFCGTTEVVPCYKAFFRL